MEVRDPIHGLIAYDEVEERIIGCPAVQRLRGIKQLALTDLVYPGACHTRFEHSLGTMYVAGRLARALKLGKEKTRIVRLVGLLHDVGHGPFSHVSEQVWNTKSKSRLVGGHEALSAEVVQSNPDIRSALADMLKPVGAAMQGQTLEWEIVAGDLGADRLDYLLRDSHHCGVKYGVYDLDRVVNTVVDVENHLAIKEEGVYAVEQLILARYHMHTQVYGHRVRLCADAMLVRMLELASAEQKCRLAKLYGAKTARQTARELTKWDDAAVLAVVREQAHTAQDLVKRLTARRLFRWVMEERIDAASFPDALRRRKLETLRIEEVQELEKWLASALGMGPGELLIHIQRLEDPLFRLPDDSRQLPLLVKPQGRGQPTDFESVSRVVKSERMPPVHYLRVYCRLDEIDRHKRHSRRRELAKGARRALLDWLNGGRQHHAS